MVLDPIAHHDCCSLAFVTLTGSEGVTCVIPYRGDDMEWRHLKPLGDYGNIVPVPFDPHNEDSMRRAIAGSDVVVNLMGKVRLLFSCCAATCVFARASRAPRLHTVLGVSVRHRYAPSFRTSKLHTTCHG